MNLENSIKDVISKKLEDGTIEKLIEEQLEKGVLNALDNMFRSYGDVTKTIEAKIKSVMVPYLESYDYSKYIVKLDAVLVDVLKSSALENKKLLSNFKDLMIEEESKRSIKVSELFEKWKEFVAKNIDTSDLEINYDDDVTYEYVEVCLGVEYENERSWSCFEYATLVFECEKDEKMNFAIRLSRYNKSNDEKWDMSYDTKNDVRSLRHLNEFEIFLMKLSQAAVKIEINIDCDSDEVQPEAEPEPSYS